VGKGAAAAGPIRDEAKQEYRASKPNNVDYYCLGHYRNAIILSSRSCLTGALLS
jgi:hypothetical protein